MFHIASKFSMVILRSRFRNSGKLSASPLGWQEILRELESLLPSILPSLELTVQDSAASHSIGFNAEHYKSVHMILGIITPNNNRSIIGLLLSQHKVHAVLHGATSFRPKEPAYSIQF